MATVTGARGTGNISSAQRKIDMADTISLLEPDAGPLTLLSKKAKKKAAVNPEFKWLEDSSEARFDAINDAGGYTTSATSLIVDNGAYFAEHYLVQNTRTKEVFRVTGVSSNTLTVVRGLGNSGTGVAMLDNDELYIIGVAQPEGDTSRPARSSNPSTVTNYTQIFREPWELTETARSSDNEANPHDWNHQANKHGIEHAKDIEIALLIGKADENTAGSQPRRATKGAIPHITTNVTAAGGTFSNTAFNTHQRQLFRYGSKRKIAFASALTVSVLNAYAASKLQVRQGESTYGLAVTDYVSPFGTQNVMTHWLLEGSVYGGYLVSLDMDEVAYRYLDGGVGDSRDTHIRTQIQANDADTRKDEYLTEAGLQFGSEKAHALVTGITG